MEIWTAFIIGIAGSFHCIGMCGPIALALPGNFDKKTSLLISRILYNTGRIITYSLLGGVCGFIGQTIALGGYQQSLSLVLGIFILIMIFLPSRYASKILPASFHSRIIARIKSLWFKHFQKSTYSSLLVIGILNGFLPCGLVYVALAGAATTSTLSNGALYMMMFGVGTFPIMLATSLAGNLIGVKVKSAINRLLPIGGIILASLLILRGMSLGIPYISPEIIIDDGEQIINCCPKKVEQVDDSIFSDSLKTK